MPPGKYIYSLFYHKREEENPERVSGNAQSCGEERREDKRPAGTGKGWAFPGKARCQFALGYMYETGTGVKQSGKDALRWYRKAAEQGDEDAQEILDKLGQ